MLIFGGITNTTVASVVLLVALLASRMLLELVYRMAFGDARLQFRIQFAAFALQTILWSALWAWHAHQTSAA
jgi:hypothetical protein